MKDPAATMTIRPFEAGDADYEAVVGISNALWPDERTSVRQFRYRDENRDQRFLLKRFMGQVDGDVVAVGTYGERAWCHSPGKYFMEVEIHPDYQRRGYGSRFHDFLVAELEPKNPICHVVWTREDKPECVRFITSRGYKSVMRYAVSRLSIAEFDFERYAGFPARMSEQGVEILRLSELPQVDEDWKRSYYELEWELFQDVPFTDPPTKETFEHFCTRFESPAYDADAHWFARDGERYVGYSGVWLSEADPKKLYTGLTGVVRTHRRRGIATALKLKGVEYARDRGVEQIETDNEENNPMFGLNLQLGFKAVPAWIEYMKTLRVEPPPEAMST